MNGVQTRFKCKLDVKRCKRFVFPPSSLLPRSNALKTKAIRYFQTDRTLTRIVSPPLKMNEELDELFNEADFAIGSLARHRSGIDKIKTLKNREYAARGIPFAYSETDEDFDKMPYILKVPADESPIDIHRLIRFYMELDLSPRKIRDSIKNLSWKEQMMKVINNL